MALKYTDNRRFINGLRAFTNNWNKVGIFRNNPYIGVKENIRDLSPL